MDIAFSEHGVQAFQCLGSLGKNGYAADRAVQPVRYAHEDLTRFRITHCYECLVFFAERLVSCLVTLDDFADLLVDGENVVVFV